MTPNPIQTDQFIIVELEPSKSLHSPSISLSRKLEGEFSNFHLEPEHVDLLPH